MDLELKLHQLRLDLRWAILHPFPAGFLKIRLPEKAETEVWVSFKDHLAFLWLMPKNVPQTWLKGQSTGIFIKCLLAASGGRTGKSGQGRDLEPAWEPAWHRELRAASFTLLSDSAPALGGGCGSDGRRVGFRSPSCFPLKPSPTVAPLSTKEPQFWAGLLGLETYPGRHRLTQRYNALLCDLDRRICHELGDWSLADPGMR